MRIGLSALSDASWLEAQRRRIAAASDKLSKMLDAAGFRAGGVRSTPALFQARTHRDAAAKRHALARSGILVFHDCEGGTIRFALPANEAEEARLAAALAL
jgi:histidinol-phosphate/aromatic aminotransferase/cobyric acid decarboxylase-like protein